MRNFNDVYNDKLNESIKHNEDRISTEYETIMRALMEDTNIYNLQEITEQKDYDSFFAKVNECFTVTDGITEKGKQYLIDRKPFLTESSTNINSAKKQKLKL